MFRDDATSMTLETTSRIDAMEKPSTEKFEDGPADDKIQYGNKDQTANDFFFLSDLWCHRVPVLQLVECQLDDPPSAIYRRDVRGFHLLADQVGRIPELWHLTTPPPSLEFRGFA